MNSLKEFFLHDRRSIPSGNTRFVFHVAGITFSSSSYSWLVIAGAKGQYKGVGTINDAGNYGFLLTAIDGEINGAADKLRMKIWDNSTGGTIIYDNQIGESETADPTTVIGGGSIVMHPR